MSFNDVLDQHFPLPVIGTRNRVRTILFLVEYSKTTDKITEVIHRCAQTNPMLDLTVLDLDPSLPAELTTPRVMSRLLNTYLLPYRRVERVQAESDDDDLGSLTSTTIDAEALISVVERTIFEDHLRASVEGVQPARLQPDELRTPAVAPEPENHLVQDDDPTETSSLSSIPSDPATLPMDNAWEDVDEPSVTDLAPTESLTPVHPSEVFISGSTSRYTPVHFEYFLKSHRVKSVAIKRLSAPHRQLFQQKACNQP